MSNYRENKGLNQSALKALAKGVVNYKSFLKKQKTQNDKKSFFDLGDITEGLVMYGQSWYDSTYYTGGEYNKESKLYFVVKNLFQGVRNVMELKYIPETITAIEKQSILEACIEFEYYPNWKDETRIKKIQEKGTQIWNDLLNSIKIIDNKEVELTIITQSDYNKALDLVMLLKTHPYVNKWFSRTPNNIEIYYKQAIYFKYKGIDCKAELDMILIDHKHKLIYIGDLKTTGFDVHKFMWQAKKLNYLFQAAWYCLALNQYLIDTGLASKGYVLAPHTKTSSPFSFIVINTTHINRYPLTWICTENDLHIGKYGLERVNDHLLQNEKDNIIKGFTQAHNITSGFEEVFDLYKWHIDNNTNFEVDKRVKEQNGLMTLNLYNNDY